MTTLTREKIEALREAARKAGGREWFVDSRPNDDGTAQVDDGTSGMFPITAEWPQAIYIAAANPATILSLCDMAEDSLRSQGAGSTNDLEHDSAPLGELIE